MGQVQHTNSEMVDQMMNLGYDGHEYSTVQLKTNENMGQTYRISFKTFSCDGTWSNDRISLEVW